MDRVAHHQRSSQSHKRPSGGDSQWSRRSSSQAPDDKNEISDDADDAPSQNFLSNIAHPDNDHSDD